METAYLEHTLKLFRTYKQLGDKSLERIPENEIHWQKHPEVNSAAMVVRHVSGNMKSRWTDFLTTDGEKPWRNRDSEFEVPDWDKKQMMQQWEQGWSILFEVLEQLKPSDLTRIVYIRGEGHTVFEAINRQVAHYAYHVGQIVYLAKMFRPDWQSLSIARNQSEDFNRKMFGSEQQ